jgi:hypothetical protein
MLCARWSDSILSSVDFFGGPRKKKTQKKAKKSSRVSVNTMDVMPVGMYLMEDHAVLLLLESNLPMNALMTVRTGVADGSSDDDVQSSRKRGKGTSRFVPPYSVTHQYLGTYKISVRVHAGGKGEALDLKDVDITTPLREDEVIPENKHRQPAQVCI